MKDNKNKSKKYIIFILIGVSLILFLRFGTYYYSENDRKIMGNAYEILDNYLSGKITIDEAHERFDSLEQIASDCDNDSLSIRISTTNIQISMARTQYNLSKVGYGDYDKSYIEELKEDRDWYKKEQYARK